jgi:hypothetical protein
MSLQIPLKRTTTLPQNSSNQNNAAKLTKIYNDEALAHLGSLTEG